MGCIRQIRDTTSPIQECALEDKKSWNDFSPENLENKIIPKVPTSIAHNPTICKLIYILKEIFF